jgi:hypothetical protein
LAYPATTEGNYTNTVVRDNTIYGGFASNPETPSETKGENNEDAIIKSVAGGLDPPLFRAKYTTFTGSVLRLDLEFGSVIGTSKTLAILARS